MTWLLAILALGLLVTIHEFGHFLVAKWLGMNVEVFSIGFGPPLPKCQWQWKGTEFRVAVFFLGGYVKIKGADPQEAQDGENLEPDDFLAQPPLKRMAVVAAGPGINYLFAWVLALSVFLIKGVPETPESYDLVLGQVAKGRPAAKAGLKAGDVILAIDGQPVRSYAKWRKVIRKFLSGCRHVPEKNRFLVLQVERQGSKQEIPWRPGKQVPRVEAGTGPGLLVTEAAPPLEPGDRILAADGRKLKSPEDLTQLADLLRQGYRCKKDMERSLVLTVRRKGMTQEVKVFPDETGLIGVIFDEPLVWRDAPVTDRLVMAAAYPIQKSAIMLQGFGRLFSSLAKGNTKVASQVSGPVGIVVVVKSRMKQGFLQGLSVVMFLSVMLGLFNILPLPALDGGHLLFRVVELVTRRRLNPMTEARIHYYGLLALLLILLLATVKDCRGLIGL